MILVGADPASTAHVGAKLNATAAAGMCSFEMRLPADTSEADLLERNLCDISLAGSVAAAVAARRPALVVLDL